MHINVQYRRIIIVLTQLYFYVPEMADFFFNKLPEKLGSEVWTVICLVDCSLEIWLWKNYKLKNFFRPKHISTFLHLFLHALTMAFGAKLCIFQS